jgi:hypothetical protein
MNKLYRIKAICNLISTTNSTLSTTGNIASKGAEKTAKWLITDHTGATKRISIMEVQQKINHSLTGAALFIRRMKRSNKQIQRLMNTGKGNSCFEVAIDWCIDHALYVFDLLWGLIWPIVSYLLMSILMIVMIIVFNVIYFYSLYLLLTH